MPLSGRALVRTLLVWGLIAGLCGGIAGSCFGEVVGEGPVAQSIARERAADRATGMPADPELVSRRVQRAIGLPLAVGLYGVAAGGLFALCFAVVHGRLGRASPAATAVWLAGVAFVVVYLVPFLKYPANPPGVGDPETIGTRTRLYVVMVAISLLAAVASSRIGRLLARRAPPLIAHATSVAAYVVVSVGAAAALPPVHELPAAFPADTLWSFRWASIGMVAVVWAIIAVVFAMGAERVLAVGPRAQGRGLSLSHWTIRSRRSRREGG
jgi:hypothetical protein